MWSLTSRSPLNSGNWRRQTVEENIALPTELLPHRIVVEQPGLEPGTHVVPSAFAADLSRWRQRLTRVSEPFGPGEYRNPQNHVLPPAFASQHNANNNRNPSLRRRTVEKRHCVLPLDHCTIKRSPESNRGLQWSCSSSC